jgi:hypothetical protein
MTLTQINKAGLDELALDHVFTIGASGSSAYTFQGEGLNGTVNNPTLYLTRGKTYRFENGTGGHPIRIQSTSGASGTAYNTGVTNNASAGTVIVEVQHDAPDVLYYQCTSHAAMNGILYITGALADGGVTTAKIAADAVTGAKIADDAINSEHYTDGSIDTAHIADSQVTTAKIADDAVTEAKIVSGAVTQGKLANNAVTTNKIAVDAINNSHISNNSVNTAEIYDEAITLAKLEHGTSSNDGKFLRANNGADPTFETVNTDLVSDTSPQLGGTLDSNGNVISLGDATGVNSNRIKLGAGDDLQIYHDGSNSHIAEAGTGVLKISGSAGVYINKHDNSETMAAFLHDAGVELYHNNSKRFETTSSGVEIHNDLLLDGSANLGNYIRTNYDGGGHMYFRNNSGSSLQFSSHFQTYRDTDEGGTAQTHLHYYHNGYAELLHQGNSVIRTLDTGVQFRNGGNVNGQLTPNGLCFGTDTAAANALDDYEEGTWTPGGENFTISSTSSARYTKIGRLVHASCYINASGTGSSAVKITGLPFNQASGSVYSYGAGRLGSASNNNAASDIVFQMDSGSNKIKPYVGDGSINASMINGTHIIFSIVYEAT